MEEGKSAGNSPEIRSSVRLSSLSKRSNIHSNFVNNDYMEEQDSERQHKLSKHRLSGLLHDTKPDTILAAVERISSNSTHSNVFPQDAFVPQERKKIRRKKPRKKPSSASNKAENPTYVPKVYKPKKIYQKKPKAPASITIEKHFQNVLATLDTPAKEDVGRIVLSDISSSAPEPEVISHRSAKEFFPESKFSSLFWTSDDNPPASIPRFKSCQYKECEIESTKLLIFTGGSVECISWLPERYEFEDVLTLPRYVAIGVHKSINPVHIKGKQFTCANMIQIYALQGIFSPWAGISNPIRSAQFVLGICHSYGCIFNMQWCPLTSTWENDSLWNKAGRKSLGILSVCFGDGSLRIFNVPHPDSLQEEGKEKSAVFIKLNPMFSFVIENACINRAKWKITSTYVRLLYSTSTGFVSVWQKSHGDCLDFIDQKNRIVGPVFSVRAHNREIVDVVWHPTRHNLFVTASMQSPVKLWDMRDPFIPIFLHHYVHKTITLDYWRGIIPHLVSGCSDYKMRIVSDATTGCKLHYNHFGSTWGASISEYLSSVATCSDDGSVNVTLLTEKVTKKKESIFTFQVAEIDQTENGKLMLRFPNTSVMIKQAETRNIDSFPRRIIGWKDVKWCPNKQSSNWIACGSNMGLVCLVPHVCDVPRRKRKPEKRKL